MSFYILCFSPLTRIRSPQRKLIVPARVRMGFSFSPLTRIRSPQSIRNQTAGTRLSISFSPLTRIRSPQRRCWWCRLRKRHRRVSVP